MRDSFHEYGKVYRIGGDEFAVIITENPNQVEELIHSFDSNVANWHGKFVDSMTVSYGWVFSTERNWGSAYEISKAADGTYTYKNNCKVYAKVSSTVYLYSKPNTRTVWTSVDLKQRQLFDLD